MRKVFLMSFVLSVFCGTMKAQTLSNGTFDADWVSCFPWSAGSYSSTAQGTQPLGWCIANVRGMNGMGATTVGAENAGRSGSGKSVVLTNTPNPLSKSQIVPGYITLGTAWATAKATITGAVTSGTADGGAFGGISFSYHPDAIHLYYKRAHKTASTSVENTAERASIIAYSWKGTWTQKDVPSNTSMSTPTKVDMADRDRNVLFNASGTVGGSISKTDDAELIASIEYYIEGDASDWTELTIPFTYKTSSTPEKFNIIIAADDFFADRSNIGGYNQLTVDDVKLLYYSELKSLTVNGVSVQGFNKDRYAYSIDKIYKEDEYDIVGVDNTNAGVANVSGKYDPETAVYTVRVEGEDISVNSSNYHEYKIQFRKPSAGDIPTLVNYLLTKKNEPVWGDVNYDGKVTLADVTALVNLLK